MSAPVHSAHPGDHDAAAFRHALALVWPYRWRLAMIALVVSAAVGGWRLLTPRSWRAEAAILPISNNTGGSLAGVAAQFGLNVPSADPTQSPAYYVEVLRSRDLMERLIAKQGGPASLATQFDVTDADSNRLHESVLQRLRDVTDAAADPKSGVVKLSILAPDPALAASLAQQLLALAQAMNVERRQARAHAEREFATRRVDAAMAQVRQAEDALREFRSANRSVRGSPSLELTQSRLERGITDAQQIVNALRQLEEQSRLDELRDTPMFTMVQAPAIPRLPEGRKTVIFSVLAFAMSIGAGVAFLLARETWRDSQPVVVATPVSARENTAVPLEHAA